MDTSSATLGVLGRYDLELSLSIAGAIYRCSSWIPLSMTHILGASSRGRLFEHLHCQHRGIHKIVGS